jgi:hypothetical protein
MVDAGHNFHLPESTLLMLVWRLPLPGNHGGLSSGGAGSIVFSYGDAMFITRNPHHADQRNGYDAHPAACLSNLATDGKARRGR